MIDVPGESGGGIGTAKVVLIGVNDSGKQYSPRVIPTP